MHGQSLLSHIIPHHNSAACLQAVNVAIKSGNRCTTKPHLKKNRLTEILTSQPTKFTDEHQSPPSHINLNIYISCQLANQAHTNYRQTLHHQIRHTVDCAYFDY